MTNRRQLLGTGLAALTLAATRAGAQEAAPDAVPDGAPEIGMGGLPPEWQPMLVSVQQDLPPGEIHVDPNAFSLYWTLQDGTAIRYKVGVGRPGLYEPGVYTIGMKKKWPSWRPTPDMVEREPEHYGPYAEEGMPGGPDNPLGARALYLFTPERGDTFMRVHGTNKPETIGKAVSNGCTRLVNEHIIDLYERVPVGTLVFLYPRTGEGAA